MVDIEQLTEIFHKRVSEWQVLTVQAFQLNLNLDQ